MKPRNKEVNIFNMSLLDILCGALGAFCFMMLVLFQYWKPEGPDVKRAKENTAQLEQQVQDLLRRMQKMSNISPDVLSQLQQMERRFNSLQGEVTKLRNMLQSAQAQTQALQNQKRQAQAELQKSQKENSELRARNPITVVLFNRLSNHDVDLYVKDGKMDEPLPDRPQGRRWNGDVFFNHTMGNGSDVWMMRDAPPQEYRVYYKFLNRNGNPAAASVWGYFLHANRVVWLPQVDLPADRRAYLMGSIVVAKDYSSQFRPAPEYQAAYQQLVARMTARQPASAAGK